MNPCYEDNKTMFITVGVGTLVSFITNIWFLCNNESGKKNRVNSDIEMIQLNRGSSSSNQNIVLNINESSLYPEFNGESLPDWVKDEYKQQQRMTI